MLSRFSAIRAIAVLGVLVTPDYAALAQDKPKPVFWLSSPRTKTTNIPTENLPLTWTRAAGIKGYVLEVSPDPNFTAPFTHEVPADKVSFRIPAGELQSNHTYYWRMFARCDSAISGCSEGELVPAMNNPYMFTTALNLFGVLEDAGLTLQRALSGDDATEGAQFSFLKTIGGKSVFTSDFALIWEKSLTSGPTYLAFEGSWEGKLTSDESESEDALGYRGAIIVNQNRVRSENTGQNLLIDLIRWESGAKYETDQAGEVGKLLWENVITFNSRRLGMGSALPRTDTSLPLQLIWRPFFGIDWGRTFENEGSSERERTVLRLVPRARIQLDLNAVRQALNLSKVFVFVDNTFYSLPLEEADKTHNFLVAGIEFRLTDQLGVGMTYKNGEAAPKFAKIRTLGGVLTIRFGR